MCIHPKRILNPTRMYYRNLTPKYLTVPCGNCEQCINRATDSWLLRLQYEFATYKNSGGIVCFPTLTYNKYYVPRYSLGCYQDSKGDCHHKEVLCFRPKDKTLFIKRLRRFFERNGLVVKRTVSGCTNNYNSELGIKYMIASEFGSDDVYTDGFGRFRHGTKRPHYHCLLFFPKWVVDKYTKEELISIIQSCWIPKGVNIAKRRIKGDKVLYQMDDKCQLGEVRYSTDETTHQLLFEVHDDKAIRYCAKYMAKDVNFKHDEDIERMLREAFRRSVELFDKKDDQVQYYNHFVSEKLPKHFQSTNLGHEIVSTIENTPSVLIEGIDITVQPQFKDVLLIHKDGKNYNYPVPRCFKEKVCYEHINVGIGADGSSIIKKRLKTKYYDYLVTRLDRQIQHDVDRLYNFISDSAKFYKRVTLDYLKAHEIYDTPKEVFTYFRLHKQDFEKLAYFSRFVNGKCCEGDVFCCLLDMDFNELKCYFKANYLELERRYLPDEVAPPIKNVGYFKSRRKFGLYRDLDEQRYLSNKGIFLLDTLPQFEGIQYLSELYNSIKSIYNEQSISGYINNRERKRNDKKCISTFDKRYAKQQSRKYTIV